MDFVDDKLADLIISGGSLPSHWHDEPLFHECLSELSACSLTRLASEPSHLRESHHLIIEQNQALAAANYHTFIRTAECSRNIFTDFEKVEVKAAHTVDSIPELNKTCESFLKEAQRIATESKMNAVTLSKHTQVLEILEIPQVMETCVRNGYYDEALEVVAYAKRLERKHVGLAVVRRVVEEVRQAAQQLLNQLIHQLKGSLQLPACLKAIGYLRRMEVFTEPELRLKFLQSRDAWLQNLLKSIPRDDPYQHATKLVEVTRVHLFDIVTQYRAVFSDEDPLLSSRDEEGQGANDSALFHSWLVLKVTQFLSTLARELDRMAVNNPSAAGRYQSLLAQCMYFGQSFSRVGCDFRPHLAEIFNNAIYSQFRTSLERALSEFTASIPVYSLVLPNTVGGASGRTTGSMLSSTDEVPAPVTLLEYPLLALLCNHILQGLNNLRLCCPVNIMPKVVSSLTACLQSSAGALAAYHRGERGCLSTREEEAFTGLCRAFASVLLPHVNHCLSLLWTPSASPHRKSRATGAQSWAQVNLNLVLASLEDFLPREPALISGGDAGPVEEEIMTTNEAQSSEGGELVTIEEQKEAVEDAIMTTNDAQGSDGGDHVTVDEQEAVDEVIMTTDEPQGSRGGEIVTSEEQKVAETDYETPAFYVEEHARSSTPTQPEAIEEGPTQQELLGDEGSDIAEEEPPDHLKLTEKND